MLAEHLALHVHKVAGNVVGFVEKNGIVPAFEEVHAFLLGGEINPADLLGEFLHLDLRHAAQREDDCRKLFCGKAREEVRLVLAVVERRVQKGNVGVLEFEAGVVAGGEVVEVNSHATGRRLERSELDVLIAAHARIGGAPGAVFRTEVIKDLAFVFLGNAHHVMRNSEPVGDRLRFGNAFIFAGAKTALAAFHVRHIDGTVPRGHRHADDLVTLLF